NGRGALQSDRGDICRRHSRAFYPDDCVNDHLIIAQMVAPESDPPVIFWAEKLQLAILEVDYSV
ncbi:MAG: hypothetical protein J6W23_03900, partial [Victivallales bacterium]|nr:hypothetical protein [Victivallales bacterium]